MTILTDRSRYDSGSRCQYKRYYNYHFGGTGIVPKAQALNLWTGTAIHKGLESFYRLAKAAGSAMPNREELRVAVRAELAQLEAIAASSGFLEEPSSSYALQEQLALAEGLIWGYIRAIAPKILADYTIELIEQEMPLDCGLDPPTGLSPGQEATSEQNPLVVRLQTRPDLILRGRASGKLSVADHKSMGSLSDASVEEFRTSPQMASCCLAASTYTGEPVKEYTIHALVKGGRKGFTKKGMLPTSPRQFSPFCYAKFSPACPPLTEASLDLGGYWYDKQATWTMEGVPGDPGASRAERLVELMPMEALWEQFALIGPYEASEFLARQFLRSLAGEELTWAGRLAKLPQEQPALDKLIPRSYKCHDYGTACPYYDLCFQTIAGWQDPLSTDRFEPRVPHHEEELAEFKASGKI